ncbi:MAG: pyridoxamine 5'-phosphate oxidase [Burkholderiales bacterium RIFCSPLOWO2_02_FULL_57_36]|nr:MAG: pyridoxamine 5'-phosphate oxidase [Burkholderiales bacterium RIFCSPLOWO2_02_FULL_57_36]
MEIGTHWAEIKRVVERGQASKLHCAIASVSPEGMPNVTPVGTVFLRNDQTGFYFDKYTSNLAKNIEANPQVCLMAVNANKFFWLRSLFIGRFASPPGVRLYGSVGPLRPATPEELQRIQARVGRMLWLKGGRLLWSGFTHVRDISFTSFRPVSYPAMMEHLWQEPV